MFQAVWQVGFYKQECQKNLMMTSYPNVIPPILFIGFWLLLCYWFSETTGWRYLAQKYPKPAGISSETMHFQSLRMQQADLPINGGGYNGVVTIGLGQDGMSLSTTLPLFRFAHPPIFVPWQDMTMQVINRGGFWPLTFVKISFAKSDIAIYISSSLAEKVRTVSNLPILQAAS